MKPERLLAVQLLFCGCAFLIAGRPAYAAEIGINGIEKNQAVKGWVNLSCDIGSRRDVTYVEYRLNGRPLSPPIATPPYKFSWYSGSIWDGPNRLTAAAFDATGMQTVESGPIDFQVANGDATITLTSPDVTKPLSGTVLWSVEAKRPLPQAEIDEDTKLKRDVKPFEALIFSVDGVIQSVQFGSGTRTLPLDTTHYANGPHQLLVSAYAFKTGIPPVAMVMKTANFENGHVLMDVRPTWRDAFLAPGHSITVNPRALYTDGITSDFTGSPKLTSENPAVATINGTGIVTAVAPGVTNFNMEAQGHKSVMRVIVDTPHGFPHFSRDGHVLTEYDPVRSVFVRSMFFLNADEANRRPGLDDAIHQAGVNALTTGFYFNPADGGHQKDFDAWKRGWEPWFDRSIQFAKEHNYLMLLTGDDICRTTNELNESITNPWAPEAIKYAFAKARDSKRVAGIEMIDEASGAWGSTPKPTNGAWQNRNPPIPDDAFTRLVGIINEVPDRPLITWPVLGVAGPQVAHNWMGDPTISDYTSHYWDILDWRRVYPGGASIPQNVKALDSAVINRYPLMQRDRPAFLLTSVTGPFYHKKGPGTEFVPGQDEFIQDGPRAVDVSVMTMYAAIMGMSGVRAYGFDWSLWKKERKDAPPGTEEQTGADPFETGTDRWQALSASYNLIATLEPYLFQPQINALDLGAQFVTGARSGPRGTLFMAMNASELPATTNVDLSPYDFTGSHFIRYRICGATSSSTGYPLAINGPVTFAPGETIAWLFLPSQGKHVAPPTIRFTTPIPNLVVTGRVEAIVTAGPAGRIARVEFYADGKLIDTATKSPYRFSWDTASARPGVWHGLLAKAYDIDGNSSQARTMVEVAPTNSS